jgi:hypothetical protein
MSQPISVTWSNIGEKVPQVSVQPDKLSNYDLILRCQEGSHPDRAAFAELGSRLAGQSRLGARSLD